MSAKKKTNLLQQAINRAKAQKKLVIIDMPEEFDTTPHWLLWLALASLVGLVITMVWQVVGVSHGLQAYLPFL